MEKASPLEIGTIHKDMSAAADYLISTEVAVGDAAAINDAYIGKMAAIIAHAYLLGKGLDPETHRKEWKLVTQSLIVYVYGQVENTGVSLDWKPFT